MSKVIRLIRDMWRCGPWRKKDFTLRRVEEEPEVVEKGIFYLVGTRGCEWSAVFTCPCGCGQPVWLNLLSGQRPRWRVSVHFGHVPSVFPSVWRQVGCHSHFFVRHGCVDWCGSFSDEWVREAATDSQGPPRKARD